jgi:cytochrome b pre-mRNA-processing protein 3
MLWPFKRFLNPQAASRGTIEAIYGMIVAQARAPVFYQTFQVPDTVDGRFDMLVLHLWLLLRRFRAFDRGGVVAQSLFDRFCSDMDANLREMGVGDLTVPKRMQKFGEAFYGRTAAYDLAFATGHDALADALARNILNVPESSKANGLCAYVEEAVVHLETMDRAALEACAWLFPSPRVIA